jgi:hypothetical protein
MSRGGAARDTAGGRRRESRKEANAAGMDDEELRSLLHDAVQERLRERGAAWERLDTTLEKRAAL